MNTFFHLLNLFWAYGSTLFITFIVFTVLSEGLDDLSKAVGNNALGRAIERAGVVFSYIGLAAAFPFLAGKFGSLLYRRHKAKRHHPNMAHRP